MTRAERFMPGGVPKHIRCYDNGGETADRYTIGSPPGQGSGGLVPLHEVGTEAEALALVASMAPGAWYSRPALRTHDAAGGIHVTDPAHRGVHWFQLRTARGVAHFRADNPTAALAMARRYYAEPELQPDWTHPKPFQVEARGNLDELHAEEYPEGSQPPWYYGPGGEWKRGPSGY